MDSSESYNIDTYVFLFQAKKWYLLSGDISGNIFERGGGGLCEVKLGDHRIHFSNSKMSTTGTNVLTGQFPMLLVKGIPSPPISKCNEIHFLSDFFGANVGLHSLKKLMVWSWNRLNMNITNFCHVDAVGTFNYIKSLERIEYMARATLRLIKSCLNQLYPKKMSRFAIERMEFVDEIYEIRQLLISMLTSNILDINDKELPSEIEPKLKHIIGNVLKETCQTFQELFNIFYPTPYLKWEILCTLLANIEVLYLKNKHLGSY
jgi:hypothetical protein